MKKYDLVIVLGSQVIRRTEKENIYYTLATHTELKAKAAGIAWQKGITEAFIIADGYNFWVRYSQTEIFKAPNFSMRAFAKARKEKSEAEIIRDFLRDNYGVPEEKMFLEELSAFTREQAEIIKILLRSSMFGWVEKKAILTMLYHMKRALPIFETAGLEVEPLFAEDLLALEGKHGVSKVYEYYE